MRQNNDDFLPSREIEQEVLNIVDARTSLSAKKLNDIEVVQMHCAVPGCTGIAAMGAEITLPHHAPSLRYVCREHGKKNMNEPDTIRIKFQADDLNKADSYCNNRSCLIAAALKRMGYPEVYVGGFGQFELTRNGAKYAPIERFNSDIAEAKTKADSLGAGGYSKALIGRTFVFKKWSQPRAGTNVGKQSASPERL